MNKKRLIYAMAALMAAGCGSMSDEAEKTAAGFIEAFMNADISKASAFCNDSIAEIVKKRAGIIESQDSSVCMKAKEKLKSLSTEIISIEKGKDTATVHYAINSSGKELCTDNRIKLAKSGNAWKIISIEKGNENI